MGRWLTMFRAATEAFIRHRVAAHGDAVVARALVVEAEKNIADLGMTVERVLRVRPGKTRCVVLCRHPRWGRCVYKSLSALGPSGRNLAEMRNMQLLSARPDGPYPEIHHIGAAFTVEAYIDGSNLRQLTPEQWARLDLVRFLEALREFRAGEPPRRLGAWECGMIINRYVDKTLRACRYTTGRITPLVWWDLQRNRRIDRLLRTALEASESVELPASLVHDDLYPDNVMVSRGGERLHLIDVEHVKEGFFGFDCLWLLSQLTRIGQCPPGTLRETYAAVCDDGFLGTDGAAVLMRAFLGFQLELISTYLRPRRRGAKARHLLDRVRRDLAGNERPARTAAMARVPNL